MKLIEINWHPTDRQLRQFGVICTFALPIIGWAWGGNHSSLVALFAIGLLCGIAGFTVPTLLKPFFVALSIVTAPIGLAVGELALLLIYFCVFVPLGIVFRLIGRVRLGSHPPGIMFTKSIPVNCGKLTIR